MIWRIAVFFDVLTVAAYVYPRWGETTMWMAVDALSILLLPLSAIERRLAVIAEAQRRRTASKELHK